MRHLAILSLLGFVSFTVVSSVEIHAALAVSNLDRPIAGAGAGDFVLGSNRELAVRFDTAPGTTLYTLGSMTMRLAAAPWLGQPAPVSPFSLYRDASGQPGSKLSPLLGAGPTSTADALYSFMPAASVVLEPGLSYWVVASLDTGGMLWCGPMDRGEGGIPGWGISDDWLARMEFDGTPLPWSWQYRGQPPLVTLSLQVDVEEYHVSTPEPAAMLSIVALGLLAGAGWHRSRSGIRTGDRRRSATGVATHSKDVKRNTLLSIALLATLVPTATARGGIFVIEAEDFDYANGQHQASASVMPYLGGAYGSTPPAVVGVDYYRSFDVVDADQYRLGETPNVPLRSSPETLSRGEWEVTVNHVIGWQDHIFVSSWYNYTRDFPLGDYRVYAALSFGYTETGALDGKLARVTSGIGSPLQTLDALGTFQADGTGYWNRFQLVPLMQGDQPALVSLNGLETLRFDALSGDFDYLLFVNQTSAIPEPASAAAAAVGCLGFALLLRRQERRREGLRIA